jgi:N-acetylmuramoyl-L-alanine amidase CwlA
MSYTLKTNLANKSNYGGQRSTSSIKYIVIHYTGNDGDTDEANGTYFKNNVVKASAHYFVDSDSVTQSVPDNYVAYSVGGSKYDNCNSTGGGKHYGKCANSNSLSIELCDDKKNGTIYPSDATISNALALTKKLMQKYGIDSEHVIRHFDVTGKSCPEYWCGSDEKNKKWKTAFHNKLSTSTEASSKTETAVKTNEDTTDGSFLVQVIVDSLNIRNGAGIYYSIVGEVKKDYKFTIVQTKGSWGKLKSGAGWINISSKYVKRL